MLPWYSNFVQAQTDLDLSGFLLMIDLLNDNFIDRFKNNKENYHNMLMTNVDQAVDKIINDIVEDKDRSTTAKILSVIATKIGATNKELQDYVIQAIKTASDKIDNAIMVLLDIKKDDSSVIKSKLD